MPAPSEDLDLLFPLPSRPPSVLSPITPTGLTSKYTETVTRLLKENHVKYHCFFNDRGFHNHLSHHILAVYFLGDTPKVIQEANDHQAKLLKPAFKSPSAIDQGNWADHLGNPL
ncbi:hypothetical protein M422DRAFT_269950 [Sphaerobolus stellatus SS14]|uniref:Uncharacterized protein n=1 Tax=Sphaerobolus stellatus (strain SS14) TaxID=990650 RepID=A0A0C9UTV1_SPHS4|nr:hypothetical protein M422DRAFT_269950 [Sphaerobolus stellatus SS14]